MFKTFVRKIIALAILPPERVLDTFYALLDAFTNANPEIAALSEFTEFIAYFKKQWFEETDILEWNVYDLDNHRTNNRCEGWHNKLNQSMGDHQPIVAVILQLHKEQLQSQVLA
jgi:hypothetical protein